jgi:membrane protein insertase Oxa1/YidC/SpoIIIJ
MMQWMTIGLFPIMLYGSPSGLCLYIMTSTLIGIVESKMVRAEFARQEAQAARFTVVDAQDVRPGTPTQKVATRRAAEPKKGLAGWLEKMQQMSEQVKKQQEAQRKRKK